MSVHFQVGTNVLHTTDVIYGDVGNNGWDDLELEYQEFLTLYTVLFPDNTRKCFWDHE
jgi:hypothetical protein